MADIHVIPGVERHDIGPNVSVEQVLESAGATGLSVVIVIGYGREGFYLATSSPDMDRNIGMAMRAVHDLLHTVSNSSTGEQ